MENSRAIVTLSDIQLLRSKYLNKAIVPNKITMDEIMYQEGAKNVLDDLERYIIENDQLRGAYGR